MINLFSPRQQAQLQNRARLGDNSDQQLQLAEALRQQAAQPLQSQMVDGHFVAPSWTQGLAQLAQGYVAGKLRGQANDTRAQEKQALQDSRQATMADFLRQANGTPEQMGAMPQATPGEPEDQSAGLAFRQQVTPAVEPNLMGAYASLLRGEDPVLQQAGLQGITQLPQIEARSQDRKDERQFKVEQNQLEREARAQQMIEAHNLKMQQLQEQNAARQQSAAEQREFQRQMARENMEFKRDLKSIGGGSGGQPFYQMAQTADGVMAFNARTGQMAPVSVAGKQVVGAQADPALQGAIAGAKTGAQTLAKTQTERRLDAPNAIQQGEQTVKLVDDLLAAPGFKTAVGAPRMLGLQKVPGTDAKDFDIRLDQLKGKQFLEAFQSLKGGGQITEVEGKKATDAISRMNASSSQKEFKNAAKEFQDVVRTGIGRAKQQATQPIGQPQQVAPKTRIRFDAQGNIIQ